MKITKDEVVSKMLTDLSKAALDGHLPVWYGVTDIVNPTHKYYELKYPEIPDDLVTLERFREGNETQDMAFKWFKGINGTVQREVEVDGKSVGISGLRGRLDFLLVDNIVEFKTTHHGIFETNDAITKNPQDLEQLCTYALLSLRTANTHYLVYFSEDYEKSFRVFDVHIQNPEKFINLIWNRLNILRDSVKKDDPTGFGRCRYFDFGCKFRANNVCKCQHLEPYDSAFLRENVSLIRNSDLEEALYQQKKGAQSEKSQSFSLWDLVTPRKAYLKRMKLLSEEVEELDQDNAKIMKRTGIAIMNSESYVERRALNLRRYLLGSTTMLSLQSNMEDDSSPTRLFPSVIRVYQNPPSNLNINSISPYYLLRLAMVCSLVGSNVGYLVIGFKEEKEKVDCYRIRFSGINGFKSQIENRLIELDTSLENKNPSSLPLCPNFLIGSCGNNCLCK